jgi:tetratricopeptide (TPR) repeat protein
VAWHGYLEYLRQNNEEAIRLIDQYAGLETGEIALWALRTKMFCHWESGDLENALKIAEEILSHPANDKDEINNYSVAWAYFHCGDIKEAIQKLLHSTKQTGDPNAHDFALCQFYLCHGDHEKAGWYFNRFLDLTLSIKDLIELRRHLTTLLYWRNRYSDSLALENTIKAEQGWLERTENKIKRLQTNKVTPLAEVEHELKHTDQPKDSLAHLALLAAKARILWLENELLEATRVYQEISLLSPELFPDAMIAIAKIKDL